MTASKLFPGGVMRIRQARVWDSAALAQIQVDNYRTSYAGILPKSYLARFTYAEQEQDWRDLLSSKSDDVLYVAEAETGEIVGYALGRPGPGPIPPYDGELVALHVRRSYQWQGTGQQLIAAVAGELQRKGSTALMLWVLEKNPARALYERLGGRELGQKGWDGNEAFGIQVKEVAYGWLNIQALAAPTEPTSSDS